MTIDNTMNPTWDETFHFTLCHRIHVGENDRLVIHIKDKNPAGAKLVGELQIGWSDLAASPGGVMDPPDGFPLRNPSKGQRGRLFMRLQFTRFDPLGPHAPPEVPGVYFRAVPGNSVRLYQSADTTPATVPQYLQPGTGEPWPVHSCWADVYAAITQAQKFIFLTGWSVHPLTRLLRGGSGSTGAAACPPIGELLKAACERGVVVRRLCTLPRKHTRAAQVFGTPAVHRTQPRTLQGICSHAARACAGQGHGVGRQVER